MLKIKFDRLDYQELAVNSISDVFKNIAFKPNDNKKRKVIHLLIYKLQKVY